MSLKLFFSPIFFLPMFAKAADQTWISGNVNNDWNTTTGTNWDAGVAWAQGNSAIFGGTGETVTLTEGISVDGITFNVANYTISGSTLTLGASTVNAAANATINSVLGGGSLNKTGAGTLTLGGANNYSGGTTWADGSVTITNGSALGTGAVGITKTTAGTLTVANTGATTVANAITLPAPGAATTYTVIKNSPGQLTGTVLNLTGDISAGNANTTLFFNSNVSGDSTTTYRLAGNNTFRATLRINRGALVVASATGLGDPANQVILDSNNNLTLGNLRFELPMTVANPVNLLSTGPIGTGANNVELSGVVSGGALLTKSGSGRLTLSNTANTHTGGITISEGTFALSGAGRLNNGAYAGAVINNGALEIGTSATQSLTGLMSGAGSFTKSGAGILNLGNALSTFSGGINITAGQVRATAISTGTEGALGTGPITIANGAALHFYVASGSSSTFANNILLPSTGSQQFIISAPASATTVRLTGQLTGGAAGQVFRLTDSAASGNHNNVLILDNPANNFQGTIEMWRGTLAFTSDAALGNADNDIRHYTENPNGSIRFDADNITLNAGRNIQLYGSNASFPFNTQGFTGTINGGISGNGTVVKQGTGTLILNGTNSYPGTTQVNQGTLLVNGTNNSAAGLITVALDATFGGTGSAGDVSVSGGGFLAPGASTGTLTVRNLTLDPTAFLLFELGAPNLGINSGSDHVAVQQQLTLAGQLDVIAAAGFSAAPGDKWLIATYNPSNPLLDGGVTLGAKPASMDPGLSFALDTQTDGQVFLTVVPEPAAATLLGVGLLVLLVRRRTL
jgi:fibronectin-binding autotransporter adhesin